MMQHDKNIDMEAPEQSALKVFEPQGSWVCESKDCNEIGKTILQGRFT